MHDTPADSDRQPLKNRAAFSWTSRLVQRCPTVLFVAGVISGLALLHFAVMIIWARVAAPPSGIVRVVDASITPGGADAALLVRLPDSEQPRGYRSQILRHGLRVATDVQIFETPADEVHGLTCVATGGLGDAAMVVAGRSNGSLLLWTKPQELPQELSLETQMPVGAVAVSADGELIAALAADRIFVYSRSGRLVSQFHDAQHRPTCLAFSPDDSQVVSGGLDGHVTVWDRKQGTIARSLVAHTSAVRTIRVSAEALALVDEEFVLHVVDPVTHTMRQQIQLHSPDAFALSTSGRLLAVALNHSPRNIAIWDLEQGRQLATLHGHEGMVAGMAFGKEDILLSWGTDHTLRAWDALSGHQRWQFSTATDQLRRSARG